MSEQAFTAAILLGASNFALHNETYGPNPAFLRSKEDFRAYLQDARQGLALADEAICDLFNLDYLPSQQLVLIGKFLEKISKQIDRETSCNLIVYYVGHGYFAGQRQEYHVALACLEAGYDATTGLKITELAEVIKERARYFRRFVILDCCFAAEALKEFQGAADDAIYAKAKGAFAEDAPHRTVPNPRRGTALYCAADKDHVARSPKELPRTMFSDALLDVLRKGDRQYPPFLSLAEVKELAWERLQNYPNPVRPVLHSPDQSEGDVATIVGLFPNYGLGLGSEPSPEPRPPAVFDRPLDQPRVASTDEIAVKGLDEYLVAQVVHQLTKLVGPIAPIIVKKAQKQSSDFETFSQLVSETLDSKERRQFLEAVAAIKKTRTKAP
jgi:Caspase domain